MHIPDGFLDLKTWLGATSISLGVLGYGTRILRKGFEEMQVPLLGLTAAFLFAAQMINFPIIGGTSGHLIGAALATILLGPWPAAMVMTSVLIIQAFVFLDGGLTALGANVLNMAVIAPFTAHYLFCLVSRVTPAGLRLPLGSFVAGSLSVLAAATATAVELAVSGTVPFSAALAALTFWHAFIGLGEGLITMGILSYIHTTRPEWLGLTLMR